VALVLQGDFLLDALHLCRQNKIDMAFSETPIPGLLIFEPSVFHDERGYFFESYNRRVWAEVGITADFVQMNQARSTRGILRGLHYQVGEMAQAKLVRVVEGEVLDVAVDLRDGSPTYGKWYGVRLSAENKLQMFVPRGFAHGYVVLSETAEFLYQCDNYYSRAHEGGLRYDDPSLAIDWGFDLEKVVVSEKDVALPFLGAHRR
jgi:dTDP-4-dehydrorhamnose 3,5-epimerase